MPPQTARHRRGQEGSCSGLPRRSAASPTLESVGAGYLASAQTRVTETLTWGFALVCRIPYQPTLQETRLGDYWILLQHAPGPLRGLGNTFQAHPILAHGNLRSL